MPKHGTKNGPRSHSKGRPIERFDRGQARDIENDDIARGARQMTTAGVQAIVCPGSLLTADLGRSSSTTDTASVGSQVATTTDTVRPTPVTNESPIATADPNPATTTDSAAPPDRVLAYLGIAGSAIAAGTVAVLKLLNGRG